MKKIHSLIVTGLLYVLFIFGFSYFDNIGLIENILYRFGFKSKTVEIDVNKAMADPVPNPPFPPPPGG